MKSIFLALAVLASSSAFAAYDLPQFQGQLTNLTDSPMPAELSYSGSCEQNDNLRPRVHCGYVDAKIKVASDGKFVAPRLEIPTQVDQWAGEPYYLASIQYSFEQEVFTSTQVNEDLSGELRRLLLIKFNPGHAIIKIPNEPSVADWIKREKVGGIAVNVSIRDPKTQKWFVHIMDAQRVKGGPEDAIDESLNLSDKDAEFFGATSAGLLNHEVELVMEFLIAGDMGRFEVSDVTRKVLFNRDIFKDLAPIELKIKPRD